MQGGRAAVQLHSLEQDPSPFWAQLWRHLPCSPPGALACTKWGIIWKHLQFLKLWQFELLLLLPNCWTQSFGTSLSASACRACSLSVLSASLGTYRRVCVKTVPHVVLDWQTPFLSLPLAGTTRLVQRPVATRGRCVPFILVLTAPSLESPW